MTDLPRLVESASQLHDLVARVDGVRRVAVDTEAASFHRYRDRVYLVQLSTDDETAIVDPLAVDDLSPIGTLLAAATIETVLHDADYDLRTLDRDYGFRARHVFDTRIAAQLAGEPAVGLSALLEKHLHVKLDKKHQRADWSMRPLPEDMLRYAAADTQYLLPLRDLLDAQLQKLGRASWAEEEFRRLENVRWTGGASDDEHAFLRLKGAKALRGPALGVLMKLYEWRDTKARELDRAPFRIMGNDALVGIAKARPADPPALERVSALPRKLAQRHRDELLEAVRSGLALPPEVLPQIPRGHRPEPDPERDARFERLKALRNRRAEAVGLDPGIVCPNNTLQAIARANPTEVDQLTAVEELRTWQRGLLGEKDVLKAVRGEE